MIKNRIKILIVLTLIIFSAGAYLSADSKKYAILKLDGSVNPISAKYLIDSIKKAPGDGNQFIVIQMDTPGGDVASMRKIIQGIFTSTIPVVVYTYPKGAGAISAGGFIMLSAHIAVMSPGSEIGAMHPVSPALDFMKKDKKGAPAGVMEKKVLNDLMDFGRSISQKRDRNVKWTERAVKKAISSTYKEALKLNIIDLIAEDMNDLLKKLHNRKVEVNGKVVTLNTSGIVSMTYKMDWKERLLNYFAHPQMIQILLMIAIVGIGIEFKSPGMIVPGVIGGVSLFIFLMAIQVIPINVLGLVLIVLAIVMFILELQIVSYGFLTIGGIASFVIGSMILFDSPLPGGHIPMSSIIGAVIFILAFVFIALKAVMRVHQGKVSTGKEGLIGESCVVLRDFSGKGKVLIHGEIWNALSTENVLKDEELKVDSVEGMVLNVKKNVE